MKKFTILFIMVLSLICNISFAQQSPVSSVHHGTGLRAPTKDEIRKSNATHKRIHKVHLNRLGWQRVNEYRKKHSLPTLGEDSISPQGQEIESSIDTSNLNFNSNSADYTNLSSEDTTLPDVIDNSTEPWFPPIGDQGILGSCVSFATTYYQLSYAVAQENNWTINNIVNPGNAYSPADPTKVFSPRWTYNMVNNGANNGQGVYDPFSLLENVGAPTWSLFPYDGSDYTTWPTTANIWVNALSQRINPYQTLPTPDGTPAGVQLIKQLLNNGQIIGFATGDPSGDFTYTTIKSCTTIGCNPNDLTIDNSVAGQQAIIMSDADIAHEMTIVGYDDNIWVDVNNNGIVDQGEMGAFKVANQWGTGYGNQGFYWIAYDALNSLSAVINGPNSNRGAIIQYPAYLSVRKNSNGTPYVPKVVAQFTVSDAQRDQLFMSVGVSATSQSTPSSEFSPLFSFAGGGGALPFTGTAVLDFTDILPSGTNKFYLSMNNADSTGKYPASLSGYTLTDSAGNTLAASNVTTSAPVVADNDIKLSTINYDYTGQLSINAEQSTGGTITVVSPTTATFPSGTNASVSITPSAGYNLSSLLDNNVTISPGSMILSNGVYTYNLNNITVNHTLTANFQPIISYLSAGSDISVAVNNIVNLSGFIEVNNGATPTVSWQQVYGSGTVVFGTPNNVVKESSSVFYANTTAQFPAPGIYMLQLTVIDGTGSQSSDILVTVTGTILPTITASAGANGSISPSGAVSVIYGTNQTFTITPNAGYTASLTVDGSSASLTGNTYTFTNVTTAHTIAASFSLQTKTITASAGANGSISPSGAVSVIYGRSQTFTITPSTGYNATLTVDGSPATLTNNTYTFTNVTTAHTIAASFSLQVSPDGSILNAGSGGSLKTSAGTWAFSTTVSAGGNLILLNGNGAAGGSAIMLLVYNQGQMYAKNSGGNWYKWSGSGWNGVGGDPRSSQIETITASAGANGSISPSGAVSVNYGASQTFTITPSAGYAASLTVDGSSVSLTGNTYTFTNVITAHTIAASFSLQVSPDGSVLNAGSGGNLKTSAGTWTFSTTVSAGGNLILLNGNGAAGGSAIMLLVYNQGQMYAKNSGGNWYKWSGSGWNGVSGDPRSGQIEAITASAGANGSISPSGAVSVIYGTNQTFTITPNAGYNAVLTVDGASASLTGNTYTITNVTTTHTIAVSFSLQTRTITASAGANGSISPSGTVSVNYGASQIFTVTPSAGYAAALTVDGSSASLTGNTYTFTNVTTAHTIAASFSLQVSPDGSILNAGSGGSLKTSAGTWAFSTTVSAGGNLILLNGNGAAGGSAIMLLVYNQGQMYAKNSGGNWYKWSGSGWNGVGGDPRVISPDGSILNVGSGVSLVTSAGTWTLSSVLVGGNNKILLNGNQAAGGSAIMLLVYNQGHMYVKNNLGNWYEWNGTGWNIISGDPR